MTTAAPLERVAPTMVRVPPAADPAGRPVRSGGSRLPDVAASQVALSPFLYSLCVIVGHGFPPGALFGDRALLGLTAVDAWRAPVLLGPYSRFYWHHPGPLYFYVLKVWTLVFGEQTVALVTGAVAINLTAAAGILVIAYRRGGRALLVWAALLTTLYLAAIDPVPSDLWNPSVTLLPFVLVLLLSWSFACGDWWAAPWLVVVASFAVQTHVGLAPGVGMALAFAATVTIWRRWRCESALAAPVARTARRVLLLSGALAFLAWLPPLAQQLTDRSGNLGALARFFSRPGSPHSLSDGITHTGLQATLLVRSLFAPVSLEADGHQGLVLGVVISSLAFAAAVAVARRVRADDALVLLALVGVELLIGVYAVTKVVGQIQFYLVQWISGVGFVLWLAVGQACIELVRARRAGAARHGRARPAVVVVVALALCLGAVRAFPGDAGRLYWDLASKRDRELFGSVPSSELLRATRLHQVVVLRMDSVTAWEVMAADALLLAQHGRRVEVVDSPVTRLLFDESRRVTRAPPGMLLVFRDRAGHDPISNATLLANQGDWSIVRARGR